MSKTIAAVLLALVLLLAYANHFQNSFHFDDAHTIVNNAAIRQINILLFFSDARSFSSLPSNQSYRPIVSTLLAIDYKMGGGSPLPFHLSIFALFVALVLLLAFFIYRLIDNVWIAFGAAALFGLHPANADTVNYIIASAEILAALGIVAAFALYLKFPKAREYYLHVLPAAIAILAKPPAAIFALLFAIYRSLFPPRNSERRLSWFAEVAPPFLICLTLVLFVQHMTPRSWVAGARDAHNYLITQPYVALHYFKTFFWPSDLSADYDLNPLTTTDDPRFWAGLVFVVLFVMMSILCARSKQTRSLPAVAQRRRVIGFGLLWFLICLLPTSLFPLAEVMNDHRTFLPYIGLVIAIAGTLAQLRDAPLAQTSLARSALSAVLLLLLCASAFATFQRNTVWRSEETLWRDVTIKSPKNGRGLMNYGNTLMAKADYNGALDYFHRALTLTPQYSILFVNMAIAEDAINQTALAEEHFKEAMRLAPSLPDSYTYYARYLLHHSRAQEADTLIRSALSISPTDVTARELLAQIDQTKTPERFLARSLQNYNEGKFEESIADAERALTLKPDYAEAFNNICAANNKLGRFDEATKACEQALRIKPDFDLARNNLQYARERLVTP
jgi:protein O-mannosyl-transferase